MVLEEFPRTSSGKVDRNALEFPADEARAPNEVAGTEEDVQLAGLFADVLGLDHVSFEADFFELGGDSLLSIRLLARANRAGFAIDPAEFAAEPTVRALAARVPRAVKTGQSESTEARTEPRVPFPLIPIQRWFFAQELPEPHHWNQEVFVKIPGEVKVEDIRRVLDHLTAIHPATRLRFAVRDGAHMQSIEPDEGWPLVVCEEELPGAEERQALLQQVARRLHAELDLVHGPLVHAALLPGHPGARSAGEHLLFLAAHHLCVDAVSWSILLERLDRGLEQCSRGHDVALEPEGTSFAAWARHLDRSPEGAPPGVSLRYWREVVGRLQVPFPDVGALPVASAAEEEGHLAPDRTEALLRDVPEVYNTRIQDVLLTALVSAFESVFGWRSMSFDLEGHGREQALFDGVDLTRTVGWFTAVWPMRLDLPASRVDPGRTLMHVKEQLRDVPGVGLQFSLLQRRAEQDKALEDLKRVEPRQILFNYLGQETRRADAHVEKLRITSGGTRSSQGKRAYVLEINALVDANGSLHVRFTFSPEVHERSLIANLKDAFLSELSVLIEHCADPDSGGRTPSDFPLAGLDQEALDRLQDMLGGE